MIESTIEKIISPSEVECTTATSEPDICDAGDAMPISLLVA